MAVGDEELDPWDLLGIAPGASPYEIRMAWRQAALRSHPDHGGDPDAFLRLRNAVDRVLSGGPSADSSPEGANRSHTSQRDRQTPPTQGRPPSVRSADAWQDLRPRWSRGPESKVLAVTEASVIVSDQSASVVEARAQLDGSLLWTAGFRSPPIAAAASGGELSVLSGDGAIHQLAADTGVTLREHQEMGAVALVAGGETLGRKALVASTGDEVVCVNAGSRPRWSVRIGAGVTDLVVVGGFERHHNIVIARTGDDVLAVIDTTSGRIRWWLRERVVGPLVAVDGPVGRNEARILWIGGREDRRGLLRGFDLATGAAVRTLEMAERVEGLDHVGRAVYVRCTGNAIVAIDANGRPKWKVYAPSAAGRVLSAAGETVVPLADGSLRFLATDDGREVHHVTLDGAALKGSAAMTHDPMASTVMVAGSEGGVSVSSILTRSGVRAPR